MRFVKPDGFTKTAPVNNPHMNYEHAIKCDTADFESRYAIRPLDELTRDYSQYLSTALYSGNDSRTA